LPPAIARNAHRHGVGTPERLPLAATRPARADGVAWRFRRIPRDVRGWRGELGGRADVGAGVGSRDGVGTPERFNLAASRAPVCDKRETVNYKRETIIKAGGLQKAKRKGENAHAPAHCFQYRGVFSSRQKAKQRRNIAY